MPVVPVAEAGDGPVSPSRQPEQALWQTSEAAVLTALGTGSRFLEGKVQFFSEVRKEEAYLSAKFSGHGRELSLPSTGTERKAQ